MTNRSEKSIATASGSETFAPTSTTVPSTTPMSHGPEKSPAPSRTLAPCRTKLLRSWSTWLTSGSVAGTSGELGRHLRTPIEILHYDRSAAQRVAVQVASTAGQGFRLYGAAKTFRGRSALTTYWPASTISEIFRSVHRLAST